jgi:hypothetical protein
MYLLLCFALLAAPPAPKQIHVNVGEQYLVEPRPGAVVGMKLSDPDLADLPVFHSRAALVCPRKNGRAILKVFFAKGPPEEFEIIAEGGARGRLEPAASVHPGLRLVVLEKDRFGIEGEIDDAFFLQQLQRRNGKDPALAYVRVRLTAKALADLRAELENELREHGLRTPLVTAEGKVLLGKGEAAAVARAQAYLDEHHPYLGYLR